MSAQGTRQVVVRVGGRVELETVPDPSPGAGEALVAMHIAGICGSDVHASHGRHPFVPLPYRPGHEVVGVVEALGAGSTLNVGERVVVEPILACGACKWCLDGRYNLCRTMVFFGCTSPLGGMADRFVLPDHRLHRVPDRLTDLQAALIEPLATPVHAVRLVGPDLSGKTVAILGAGTIGLLVLAVVRHHGAVRIAVSEPLPAKRAMALAMGADAVFDANDPDTVRAIRADLGESADIVFDCVAIQSTMDQAIAMAIKGGTVVVVGVPAAPVTVPLPEIQDLQVRIQGSATYVRDDFTAAIALLEQDVVRAEDIITARYPLSEAAAAFEAASSGSNIKVVITGDQAAAQQ